MKVVLYDIVFYELNTNMTGFSGLHVFQLHAIVFHYHGRLGRFSAVLSFSQHVASE